MERLVFFVVLGWVCFVLFLWVLVVCLVWGLHFFFNISTVLPVILISQLSFQYVLCALLEFLPVHPSSIILQCNH